MHSGIVKLISLFSLWLYRRKNLERVFPIVTWLPKYDGRKAVADAIAGITVGLTVLAQGLAYATVAGLPPIVSCYSKIIHNYYRKLWTKTMRDDD